MGKGAFSADQPVRPVDAEIIDKLKIGDAEALAWLVEEYKDKVLNTCYRFLFNREDAEETAQEVFVEVLRSVGSFRGEAKLSTWIYRIAVSKSLDSVRKKNRQKLVSEIRRLFGAAKAVEEDLAVDENDPARRMEREERLRIVQAAIRRLPEKQGVAFTLSKCEGMGNREIAVVMDLSLPAVDALIHRAKGNLQKQLTAYFEKKSRNRRKDGVDG